MFGEWGTLQTTRSDVAKGSNRILRKSLKELPRSLATERGSSQARRARDMRIEDPDQLPDRKFIEGTGASSSRDGAGHEAPSRPVESSASADQPPREQSDDADMADPDSDRRRPRESLGEERETKRVRMNVLDGEESDEWVETEEEWVRIHRRPQGGPKLSDISKRRGSVVCSTDGGERRIVDRWAKEARIMSTGRPVARDTRRRVDRKPKIQKVLGSAERP